MIGCMVHGENQLELLCIRSSIGKNRNATTAAMSFVIN
jgi:hypothetical protein